MERPENEGSLNVVPIKVEFSNHQKLYLLGGQSACIIVSPGDYTFKARSDNPYPSRKGKPKYWESRVIKIHASAGQTVSFVVSPAKSKRGYAGGWDVKAAAK